MVSLFSLCPYIDQITTEEDALFEARTGDYFIWQQSLPFVFNTELATVPSDVPYIHPDAQLARKWKRRLSRDKNFKIGICWQANPSLHLEKNPHSRRSIPLHAFKPIADVPGVSLYSLQKIAGTQQLYTLPEQMTVYDFGTDFDQTSGPFMDTAAIMKELDLVITVDTSIAHLAGALGTAVWVFLPRVAEWRWMLERADSPWYPSMRLFRQKEKRVWHDVISDVAQELKACIESNNNAVDRAYIKKIGR